MNLIGFMNRFSVQVMREERVRRERKETISSRAVSVLLATNVYENQSKWWWSGDDSGKEEQEIKRQVRSKDACSHMFPPPTGRGRSAFSSHGAGREKRAPPFPPCIISYLAFSSRWLPPLGCGQADALDRKLHLRVAPPSPPWHVRCDSMTPSRSSYLPLVHMLITGQPARVGQPQ